MIATTESPHPLDYITPGHVALATCPDCGGMMTINVTYGVPAEPIYCIADRHAILEIRALISDDVVHSPALYAWQRTGRSWPHIQHLNNHLMGG